VGVVGSVHQTTLDAKPKAELYFALAEAQRRLSDMSLVVRTTSDPDAATHDITRVIRKIDPNQPVYRVEPMRDVVTESVSDRKLYLDLLAGFAGLALALTGIGLFGVVSYTVSQRTREIGVRIAIGARPSEVFAMVVRSGMRLVLLGIVAGLAASLLLGRAVESFLFGVGRADPATLAAIAAILGIVGVLACVLPARRAVAIDPLEALRYQ